MVVRLTRFNLSPEKAQEAKKIYKKGMAPEVKKQKGNVNVMLLEPLRWFKRAYFNNYMGK